MNYVVKDQFYTSNETALKLHNFNYSYHQTSLRDNLFAGRGVVYKHISHCHSKLNLIFVYYKYTCTNTPYTNYRWITNKI